MLSCQKLNNQKFPSSESWDLRRFIILGYQQDLMKMDCKCLSKSDSRVHVFTKNFRLHITMSSVIFLLSYPLITTPSKKKMSIYTTGKKLSGLCVSYSSVSSDIQSEPHSKSNNSLELYQTYQCLPQYALEILSYLIKVG